MCATSGHIPIVYMDGQPLIESFAVLRKFSKQAGEYGKDDERDYLADMMADAVAEFRYVAYCRHFCDLALTHPM